MMTRRRFARQAAALAVLVAGSGATGLALAQHALQTQGATVAGVKVPGQVSVGGKTLGLNGAGVRYKAIFKVYTAALYLPSATRDAERALRTEEPRRLHIVMLRDIDGRELGKLFTRGMEQSVARNELSKIIPGMVQMADLFSSRNKLLEGEDFTVDWIPGEGTRIAVKGKHELSIKEPAFNVALMKIWLGQTPADHMLKDALLGIAAQGQPAQ
jgi:hypothetical protein